MKVYIAGPMTGIPQFNFPRFFAVETACIALGWHVFNPARHDITTDPSILNAEGFAAGDVKGVPNFNLHAAMTWDLERVLESDAIVLLPNWERSSGARYERACAEATGKRIYLAAPCGDDEWDVTIDPVQKRISVQVAA